MEVLCQCGCGESFEFSHLRPHRKYWNHNCATRADRRRQKAAGTLKRYPRATGDEWGHEKEFILGLGRGIHTRVVLATREQLLRGYLRGLETRDPAPSWKGKAHDLVTQILETEFGAKGEFWTERGMGR
jgi:hypothetical protein